MNRFSRPATGWIEVVTGSMFSGKSEELIRRLRRAQIARQKVQIFKPLIDNRYADDHIVSHSDMRIASQKSRKSRELLQLVDEDTEVVGIDEGQFFDAELPAACNTLADRGKRVIVAGLDQDYLGRPFEPMPQLLAIAEYITKTLAICVRLRRSREPHAAARREQRPRRWSARQDSTKRGAVTASSHRSRWRPLSSLAPAVPKRNGKDTRRRPRERGRGPLTCLFSADVTAGGDGHGPCIPGGR